MSRLACWLAPALLLSVTTAPAQSSPPPQEAPAPDLVLLVGTVHPITAPPFEAGALVLGKGRILAVGPRAKVAIPAGIPVVSLPGAHAYPGLIDAWSQAFLPAGGLGEGNAGLDTLASLDRTSADGRAIAAGGITTAHVGPTATGRWLGLGALIQPRAEGFTPFAEGTSGAVFSRLAGAPGQHAVARRKDLSDLGRVFEEAEAYVKALAKHGEALAKYEKDWQAYLEALRKGSAAPAADSSAPAAPATSQTDPAGEGAAPAARPDAPKRPTYPKAPLRDPARAALHRVASGELRIFIEAQRRDEIDAALALVQERGLRHAALLGAQGVTPILDEVARSGIAVVLAPVGLPVELDGEPVPDTLAAELHRRGIPFAIASGDPARARALTLMAATCVGQGLPEEAAVRAITLTPAELLGIAQHTGSLEAGKRADIVVTSAPLLRSEARVLRVLVGGHTIHQGR